MIRFIDEHKHERSGTLRWGIEPIAKTLGIAPSTYHAAKKRPQSARAVRDGELRPQILRVWEENLAVYGADKIWDQLNKDEVRVARCTVERLVRDMGLQGCRRGRVWVRTTEGDDTLDRPADLVERKFTASAPNRLWVADLTYVKTHSGWVYVAFIVDVFSRMIVGWQASRSLRSDLAIDALEMTVFNRRRQGADLSELIRHSDRGVQYLSVRYSDRLADNEIVASVGSKGDSHDNALVESFNGLYKWELIYRQAPGRASTTSSSPPSPTSTGSTTDAFTARSNPAPGSSPRPRSKQPTTVKPSQPTRPGLNNPSLYRTRGASWCDIRLWWDGPIARTLGGVDDSTVVEMCRVLGDPVRWKVVSELRCGTRCACELGAAAGAAPSLLSHHLGVLRDCGVVTAKRRGRWIDYTLASHVLDELVAEIQMLPQQGGDTARDVHTTALACESVRL